MINKIKTIIYQNNNFAMVWKPAGIPSTFGKEKSFLDLMEGNISESPFTLTPLSELLPADLVLFGVAFLEEEIKSSKIVKSRVKWEGIKTQEELNQIIRQQVDRFGQEKEFGLLNRLDNDTTGFLYFAKTPEAYDNYKQLQKEGKIQKFYLAQVFGKLKNGNIEALKNEGGQNIKQKKHHHLSIFPSFHLSISFPIMHRTAEKMIAIREPRDVLKGRGTQHQVTTQVELLHYDKEKDISTLGVTIHKGIRHQIRVHLASNGTPIIGDGLYGISEPFLHLWSMGFYQ